MWISSGTTARASLVAHMVKNPPATRETWVWSLGWEDPLEEGMAPHSSILARKIPWTEEPGGLQSMGSLRVGHNWATSLSLFTFMHWRRKWQPAPAFCLENPRGREAWRAVQSMSSQQDVTEQPSTAQPQPSSLTRFSCSWHRQQRPEFLHHPACSLLNSPQFVYILFSVALQATNEV